MKKPNDKAKRLAVLRRRLKRKTKRKVIRPTRKAERAYIAGLRDIVTDLAKLVNRSLMPWLHQRYTPWEAPQADHPLPFTDGFTTRLNQLRDSYAWYGQDAPLLRSDTSTTGAPPAPPAPPAHTARSTADSDTPFGQQIRRLAEAKINVATAEGTEAVRQQVNAAVGVDLGAVMRQEQLTDYVAAAVQENVSLIRTIPDRFFGDIERKVLDGYRSGRSLKRLAQDIQGVYSQSDFNAQRIARDQISKITSDVMIRRMKDAGVERFRWSTSADERVTGNPAGRYPNAKVKCWAIAHRDIGYGPGVYLLSEGAEVNGEKGVYPGRAHIADRCIAVALFPGIDYMPWDE